MPRASEADINKVGHELTRQAAREKAVADADRRAALLVGRAQELLVTSQRVAGCLGRLASNEGPVAPVVEDLHAVLNDITSTRRALDCVLNDVQEATDRVLDAFDAKTRHLLAEK